MIEDHYRGVWVIVGFAVLLLAVLVFIGVAQHRHSEKVMAALVNISDQQQEPLEDVRTKGEAMSVTILDKQETEDSETTIMQMFPGGAGTMPVVTRSHTYELTVDLDGSKQPIPIGKDLYAKKTVGDTLDIKRYNGRIVVTEE